MAFSPEADFASVPRLNKKPNLAKRILDSFGFSSSEKADEIDVNALLDWNPVKLRSFGYTDAEIDYLFAKANQSR